MKNLNKKIKTLITLTMISGGILLASTSHAQVSEKIKFKFVDNSTGMTMKVKEKIRVDLNGWSHVEKVKIKVKGEIPGFTVYSNGYAHTPTYIPGAQPYYECPVNEAVNLLEFVADQAAVLGGISYGYVDRAIGVPFFGGGSCSVPAEEVRKIIQGVEALSQFVSLQDQQTYMLPIKIAAGHALALEYGRGEYSMRSGAALQALIAQVDFAQPYIEQQMSINAIYDWAVYLISVKERLAQMTN